MGEDVRVGDAAFDREVHLSGPPVEVLAMMDQESRAAVRALLTHGGALRDGELRLLRGGVVSTRAELLELAGILLSAARAVRPIGRHELPDRLAANATLDTFREVRLRNLAALREHLAGSAAAVRAGQAAVASSDVEIQFAGAQLLDPHQSLPILKSLLSPSQAPADLRTQALAFIAAAPGLHAIPELTRLALGDPDPR